MSAISDFMMGLQLALAPSNLLLAFIGCVCGTLIGVLPGIGPLATISLLLSLTLSLDPLGALIMLSGIYYGAQYGGSTTAILCNLPGEATSVVTCIDGNKMALQGRAGAALATAALSSLFAGLMATAIIVLFAPPLAHFALNFNSPEYFALMVLGLIATVVLSTGTLVKSLAMVFLGILLGSVGSDVETGINRFTFGSLALFEGISLVGLVMGIFGLGEIIRDLSIDVRPTIARYRWRELWITREEFRHAWPAALRGSSIGSLLGILPGVGLALSPFAAYMTEKKVARDPSRFGNGAIEGVAAPEAANNASAQTSFIPLLTLGIPSNGILAVMFGAMVMQGIQPGPNVINTNPDLFWGLIASMIVGNFMLVIINLPMVGVWVKLLRVPHQIILPSIVTLCCVGAYSVGYSQVELYTLAAFAAGSVIFYALGFPFIPLLLGFILGPLAEEHLRRMMVIGNGDFLVILDRPIAMVLLGCSALMLLIAFMPRFQKRKVEFVD